MIIKEDKAEKVYSDGEVTEARMLQIAKEYPEDLSQEYISKSGEYTLNNTFSSVRRNLLNWYDFGEDASVLEVGAGMGALTGLLCDECACVTSLEPSPQRASIIKARYPERKNLEVVVGTIEDFSSDRKFDYAVVVGVLEYAAIFSSSSNPYVNFLQSVRANLKPNGKLLLAIENQYGLKYWLGAAEDHLQKPFAGINGYREDEAPRTFSRAALSALLEEAGFQHQRIYSVLPDYKFPTMLFTDEWKLNSKDLHNVAFTYGRGSVLTTDEKALYSDLIDNDELPFFANSLLVEAGVSDLDEGHAVFVVAKGEIKPEYRVVTKIDSDDTITKIPAHQMAKKHLQNIEKNEENLSKNGLNILSSRFENGKLYRPIAKLQRADDAFTLALRNNDLHTVLSLADLLRKAIIKSSPIATAGKNLLVELGVADESVDFGPVLANGYFDLTFYNAFIKEGDLIFFDQEWCFSNVPLNFILYYAIKAVFSRSGEKSLIGIDTVLKYLQIDKDKQEIFNKAESKVWQQIFYREGDFYGEDGYCTQYKNTQKLGEILADRNEIRAALDAVNCELNNKIAHIDLLLQAERDLQVKVVEKESEYTEMKEAGIRALEELQKEKNAQISELEQMMRNKEAHIEQLLEPERELYRIKNSRSWRYMSKFWRLRDMLVPKGSLRRLFVKIMVKFIKHPLHFLSKCSPKRIGKAFTVLKKEGARGVSYRMDNCLNGCEVRHMPQEIPQLTCFPIQTKERVYDYDRLVVPQYESPDVSIVIPVYNQFDYTYLCVKSIIEHSDGCTYEIIIADDCSTDFTKDIDKAISGLRIVRNAKNLRFLLNCNNAAKLARGKYILFLNNDTQVQDNWLEPLVTLIESSEEIGLVGSKLVYPDGRLQEAGGILWKDGSAWNYGNGSNPDLPEYNYIKEVDYISGASIMLSRKLWEDLGGFDEQFAPAYYEDVDIAFEIRRRGYKVMYQPLSVVVHFEGLSNGKDVSNGVKKYQVINKERFYKKWKNILQSEHFENGTNVFQARDRSRLKNTILVIDHYIPTYDKDTGSRTLDQDLRLLVDQGHNVKFLGDNFYRDPKYASRYEQWGIEILYGQHYSKNWKNWVQENKESIKYVYMNRPHISIKYIDYFRQNTKAHIIYHGVDLHFLREYREYQITGDRQTLQSSQRSKIQELSIMRKADVVFTISSDEKQIINSEVEGEKAIWRPVFYYHKFPERKKRVRDSENIIFVGGFSHRPNEDGMLWFVKEIWPQIHKVINCKLIIIGSNPTDSIKNLASDDIIVTGYVSDEELENYYEKSRICVIPLRYGAGVKGKTIEAMYHQIPVVATSIGVEGLAGIDEYIKPTDEANGFAERVIELYGCPEVAEGEANRYLEYLKKNYSYEKASEIFREVFSR